MLQQQQGELEPAEHRIALQAVDLADLAATVIEGLRPTIEARGIALYTMFGSAPARVTGDPGQLQEILWDISHHVALVCQPGAPMELCVGRSGPDAQVVISGQRAASFIPGTAAASEEATPLFEEPATAPVDEQEPALDPLVVSSIVEQHGGRFEIHTATEENVDRYVIEIPVRAVATPVRARRCGCCWNGTGRSCTARLPGWRPATPCNPPRWRSGRIC